MTGQALTTELSMTFPDEKTREDFEIALRGFIKQYQMQATAALAAQGGVGPGPGGSAGDSSALGKIRIPIPIPGFPKPTVYLNFIPGW